VAKEIENLLAFFPAFTETVMAAEEVPNTIQEVTSSIQDTVLSVWADFVDRIPFLASGLAVLLLWRFPFENGDYIECQGISGRVEDISIRMTTIRLVSGELVVMLNSVLFRNPVEVLTSQNKRRVTIITGVAYSEDVKQAVSVIDKAIQNCDSVKKDEEIQIFPQAFGSSSIASEGCR
jgi:hypothetical protein